MVLVGIFTKLGLEKAQGPQTEMTVSRTLTDLLKQPGHSPSENMDSLMGGVQVPLGEGVARGPPRNSTDKPPLNNAVAIAPSLGRPHSHGKRLPLASSLALSAPDYTSYTTLKVGGECHSCVGWDGGGGAPQDEWGVQGGSQKSMDRTSIP
ncbi:SHSA8 protein, partial [Xiphorhynchus elegans]|nr:SHSA8 protein [Xiphorhynchus elegans]